MNSEIAQIKKDMAESPPTAGSFEDRRARWESLYHEICPIPAGTVVTPIALGGPRGEWVTAPGVSTTELRVLFYIHGGGFTAGSAAAYRGLSSRLSTATGCRVLAVDYRWAPEEPFPAALDDCVGGLSVADRRGWRRRRATWCSSATPRAAISWSRCCSR